MTFMQIDEGDEEPDDADRFIKKDEAKGSKYVAILINSELLDRRETYMGNKKSHCFEIGDPLLRLWYSFI